MFSKALIEFDKKKLQVSIKVLMKNQKNIKVFLDNWKKLTHKVKMYYRYGMFHLKSDIG
jgi:hypothetical protein